MAYTFLQIERRRRGQQTLTLPQIRALIQDALTVHYFVSHPTHFQRILALVNTELRI